MDLVAFVLNTIIGALLLGGTIGFLMQTEPPTPAAIGGVVDDPQPTSSLSPSVSPGPCAKANEKCAGPSYAPPTRSP